MHRALLTSLGELPKLDGATIQGASELELLLKHLSLQQHRIIIVVVVVVIIVIIIVIRPSTA